MPQSQSLMCGASVSKISNVSLSVGRPLMPIMRPAKAQMRSSSGFLSGAGR